MSSTQRIETAKKAVRRKTVPEVQHKKKRWDTITDWARAQGAIILGPLAKFMARLGIHPNTITLVGVLLQVGIGALFGLGYLMLGGWLLLALSPVDALDGLLARTLGKQSRFGAFLDSTMDRISDAALILGLATYYIRQGNLSSVALLLAALVASLMVSYIRARAESLGFSCKGGLLTRMERLLLIGVACAFGLHFVSPWILPGALAVLSIFTMVQRILSVYAATRQLEEETER